MFYIVKLVVYREMHAKFYSFAMRSNTWLQLKWLLAYGVRCECSGVVSAMTDEEYHLKQL
ncbi:hypothetical protein T11_14285 [Trichinella zimbabwensis]|uniref:Uncharacterized protein n=1 Tax=Trichinella zimbabwensis TaxID=268475 RepID=A0A0V1H6D1_9BILA|nr:hypothetical protein T11_14285 [Trichinella zimbabwensis]